MAENNPSKSPIRVLHSVGTYLTISENWIYPQITCVPDVSSRVLCNEVVNRDTFPIEEARLYIKPPPRNPPPWKKALGIPKLYHALAWRVGWEEAWFQFKINRWKPQILHAHFGPRGWESISLKRWFQCPLVTSFYGYDAWLLPKVEPVWMERYQELFANGDAFLVEGPAMRERLGELGCPREKVVIQRIGADLDALSFEARDFSGELKAIMVGRFVEKKGLEDGLRACARACAQGANISVTVVGGASAGDEAGRRIKQELLEIAKIPELVGRVRFTGFAPLLTTRKLLKEHNIFLCPSKHAASGDAEGGSPVALTEAMASGLLCVGTRHCDIPEVIKDGVTGYLCDEGDVAGLAETICALTDSNRLVELTLAGRCHVEKNFSLPIQISKLRMAYEAVLNDD